MRREGAADNGESQPIIQRKKAMSPGPPPPSWKARDGLPARWQLAFISMVGFVFLYALRFNISQTIVAMTGNVSLHCHNRSIMVAAELDWDSEQSGYVQSSFFYGYALMALPGAWMAGRFGSKRVLAGSMLLNAILCLLTPVVSTIGVGYVIALRILQGMIQAPFYPCMHRMWGRWSPQAEVGMLASITYSGPYIGNIVSYFVGGILSERGFGAHAGVDYCGAQWPSVFYVFGAGALIWVVVWLFMAFDTPAQHPRISHCERTYIEKGLANECGDPENRPSEEPYALLDVLPFNFLLPESISSQCRVPWKDILKSLPVWALLINLLAYDYGMYTLMTEVPSYLKNAEKVDIQSSGIFSALPFGMMWLVTLIAGAFTRLPVVQANISITRQRKILTLIGCFIPAVFLVLAGYNKSSTTAIVYITVAGGISGCQMVGSGINQIDLSPRYADMLVGWTNMWGSVGGILAPTFVGQLVPHLTDHEEWKLVFFVTAGMFVLGGVIYGALGTAKRQTWGESKVAVQVAEDRITSLNHYAPDRPLLVESDTDGPETDRFAV